MNIYEQNIEWGRRWAEAWAKYREERPLHARITNLDIVEPEQEDDFFFHVRILTRDGTVLPFKLTPIQRILWDRFRPPLDQP